VAYLKLNLGFHILQLDPAFSRADWVAFDAAKQIVSLHHKIFGGFVRHHLTPPRAIIAPVFCRKK
jgi:hypothetical protein